MTVRPIRVRSWPTPEQRPSRSTFSGSTTGILPFRVDLITVVSAAFLFFIAFNVLADRRIDSPSALEAGSARLEQRQPVEAAAAAVSNPGVDHAVTVDPEAIAYPYRTFTLTQGLHGWAYGHKAIDIAAGKGEIITSPIQGVVAANYLDEYGNTTLIIENERYQVTLLHGLFSPEAGKEVNLGQPVGTESNQGYTTDMQGRPCRDRDCGYHTHLNIFDRVAGQNVNPLDVLEAAGS